MSFDAHSGLPDIALCRLHLKSIFYKNVLIKDADPKNLQNSPNISRGTILKIEIVPRLMSGAVFANFLGQLVLKVRSYKK